MLIKLRSEVEEKIMKTYKKLLRRKRLFARVRKTLKHIFIPFLVAVVFSMIYLFFFTGGC